MTTVDPAYARRLMRAVEDALTRRYGRDTARAMLRAAETRSAAAPTECSGSVVGGAIHAREIGGNTHHAEDDRDAAR